MNSSLPLPDETLVARVLAGEPNAFEQLVLRYERALLRVAASRLGRRDLAEDVVQETFLSAFKSLSTFDASRNFRIWLWTILLHKCHRHHDRRASRPLTVSLAAKSETGSADVEGQQDGPLERLLARERSLLLESLLARLTPPQADALRLRFFGGLKFQEIADTMGCSLNTAKMRVRVGLEQIARLINAETIHPQSTTRQAPGQDASEAEL